MARDEISMALFTPLVTTDDRGEFVALMAERVPSFANGDARWVGEGDDRHLEVTLKIRKGFKWHDGRPVTARDVRFYWELMLNPKFAVDDRFAEQLLQDVAVVDDQTVTMKFHSARQARAAAANGFRGTEARELADWKEQKEPIGYRLFPIMLGALPEHILGKVDPATLENHDFARRPVGSGPYRFKEWGADQTITLEAFADYALGPPKIQSILFRIIREPTAQLAALQSGEVDVVTQVQGLDVDRAPDLDRLAAAGLFKVHYVPGAPWEHLDFNLDNEHLKEKNVRRAIAHGISREQIVDKVLGGKTRVAHSWVQPGIPPWAWDEASLVTYAFDPTRARALLAEIGYQQGPDGILARSGKRLQLKLQSTDQQLRKNTAQQIQQQLRAIGVGVDLEFLPGRSMFETRGPLKQRTFEMGLYTWLAAADPDRIDYLHSRNIPAQANGYAGNNYMGYRNPRIDELTVKGAAELDIARARPIYLEMQKIVTDDLPVLPLFQRVIVAVARARLQGFRPPPTGAPETWNIHEWVLA